MLTPDRRPCAVLDTNVVLDWLVFQDRRCLPLVEAITSGLVEWIATEEMMGELRHVLSRGVVDAWATDHDKLWAAWQQHCRLVSAQTIGLHSAAPRCSDPDDQKFIELALDRQATWLLTRDRAVLKLSRRVRDRHLHILTPDLWASIARGSI